MYALNDLDEKALKYIEKFHISDKFFIEAGANDGICQSNTAMLEFHYGWRGALVEPNLENYQKAVATRRNSSVYRAALVSDLHEGETIKGIFSADSTNRWNGLCSGVTENHLLEFPEWVCDVPAMTLNKILDDCHAPTQIGLFSLDVEGYELDVLRGLDTEKWRPKMIMMEIAQHYDEEVLHKHLEFMSKIDYVFYENMSPNDFLFLDSRVIKL
jgi:FkbM family methyltransferase